MAFIGSNDLLVLQKGDGRVRRVINGVLQPGSGFGRQCRSCVGAGAAGHRASSEFSSDTVCLSLLYGE